MMDGVTKAAQADAAEQAQALGRELVRSLLVALKVARTHGCKNDAGAKAVGSLLDVIEKLADSQGSFTLNLAQDLFFLDRTRLRMERTCYSYMEMLVSEFTSRSIGSLSILCKVRLIR